MKSAQNPKDSKSRASTTLGRLAKPCPANHSFGRVSTREAAVNPCPAGKTHLCRAKPSKLRAATRRMSPLLPGKGPNCMIQPWKHGEMQPRRGGCRVRGRSVASACAAGVGRQRGGSAYPPRDLWESVVQAGWLQKLKLKLVRSTKLNLNPTRGWIGNGPSKISSEDICDDVLTSHL